MLQVELRAITTNVINNPGYLPVPAVLKHNWCTYELVELIQCI